MSIAVGDRVTAEGMLGNVMKTPRPERDDLGKLMPRRVFVQWDGEDGQQNWRADSLQVVDLTDIRSLQELRERVSQRTLAERQRQARAAGRRAEATMFLRAQQARAGRDFERACRLLWAEMIAASLKVSGVYPPGPGDNETEVDVGMRSKVGYFHVTVRKDGDIWGPAWTLEKTYDEWTSLGYDEVLKECDGHEALLDAAVIKAAADACEAREKEAADAT